MMLGTLGLLFRAYGLLWHSLLQGTLVCDWRWDYSSSALPVDFSLYFAISKVSQAASLIDLSGIQLVLARFSHGKDFMESKVVVNITTRDLHSFCNLGGVISHSSTLGFYFTICFHFYFLHHLINSSRSTGNNYSTVH